MLSHLRANLLLLVCTVLLCSIAYPAILLGLGQTVFPSQAEGSLIRDAQGNVVGSRLIAQPFSADENFWPRPSAASYNGAASGASNWGGSNYQLRDRVANALGPIVKYSAGSKKGQPVAPDIEVWFQLDQFQGKAGLVAQWADMHNTLAQNWAKADKLNGDFVTRWAQAHPDAVAQWKKDNPDTPEPKPEDLAVIFFEDYSKTFPGTFPSIVEHKTDDGKTEKRVEPVKEGSDIQSKFFDLWRQDHPTAELEDVPADLVMASGSGLDPHITLKNALYQLDRVAAKRAELTKGDAAKIQKEIEDLLRQKARAPLNGLVGGPMVNVLEVNLELQQRYPAASDAAM
jgi:potassium-transporting ATPase KdpC subunit